MLAAVEVDLALDAVDDQRELRFGGFGVVDRRGGGSTRHAEALDVHMLAGHAGREQRLLDLVDHRGRPAHERLVDRRGRDQRGQELLHLGGIDAAVEEIDVLLLAREHVVEAEARQVAVLQVLERLVEHHARLAAVAVDQREARARLARERRADQRQHRRDAAARGERDVVLVVVRRQRREESPLGRHHVDRVAGLQRFVDPDREATARHFLDRDAQLAVVATRAQIEYERRSSSPSSCVRSAMCWPCTKR